MLRLYQEFRSYLVLSLKLSLVAQPGKLLGLAACGAPPVGINDIRNQRRPRIDPLMLSPAACFGRTVQLMFTVRNGPDFDLTPVELFLANDAKALVIERIDRKSVV